MKRYQEGGMPKPDMRPYEEQQKDIDMQSKKKAAEKQAAAIQRAKDAEMDKKMREAREKFYGKKPKKMASGGYVRAADGCAKKGKTRGKMV